MSPTKLLALLLLALAVAARAEEPAAGVLTRAPAVVTPATPAYPEDAKARGVSGEVTLELDVSAEGEVVAARVTKPAGEGFDEAALAAARALRFSPAEIDGKPAAVTLEYRFRFDAPPPAPPPVAVAVLRGVVLERGTREPLAGVAVSAGDQASTFTDREGRFELPGLPPGPVKVVASDPAHHRFETDEVLEPGTAVEVKYWLRRSVRDAYEAVVVGERDKKEVTSVTVTSGEVGRVAGVSGDTVKIVQNLPGVARAPGGFGMLVVRGGNPTDTRVYVDGVEVPLVFHFGGLTSIVPGELVDAVDFEAGNFGVRYGRATGGRVDLRTRDPGSKRLHLVADGNLYHALAMVEGPVREDVTIALAARRSYADALISAAARSSDAFGVSVAPRYYDYQGKVTWRAGPDDTLRLSVLGVDDRMELTGIDTGGLEELDRFRIGTAFVQATGSWDHRFSESARARRRDRPRHHRHLEPLRRLRLGARPLPDDHPPCRGVEGPRRAADGRRRDRHPLPPELVAAARVPGDPAPEPAARPRPAKGPRAPRACRRWRRGSGRRRRGSRSTGSSSCRGSASSARCSSTRCRGSTRASPPATRCVTARR